MNNFDKEIEQLRNLRSALYDYQGDLKEHLHTIPELKIFSYNTSFHPILEANETIGEKKRALTTTLKRKLDDEYKNRLTINLNPVTAELVVCYRINIEPTEQNIRLIEEKTNLRLCEHDELFKYNRMS